MLVVELIDRKLKRDQKRNENYQNINKFKQQQQKKR